MLARKTLGCSGIVFYLIDYESTYENSLAPAANLRLPRELSREESQLARNPFAVLCV
jgi:hypothetical protein